MEKITIEIKRKHFLNAEGFYSNYNCPLALAFQDYFNDKTGRSGHYYCIYKNENYYIPKYWNVDFVNNKIEEAQKCLKSKKKFNSVFLELTK